MLAPGAERNEFLDTKHGNAFLYDRSETFRFVCDVMLRPEDLDDDDDPNEPYRIRAAHSGSTQHPGRTALHSFCNAKPDKGGVQDLLVEICVTVCVESALHRAGTDPGNQLPAGHQR